jgi:hypothetical protein
MIFYEPPYRGLSKLISGGQCGADFGGVDAGLHFGIKTGGHVPYGWRTHFGPKPELALHGLVEHPSAAYQPRTRVNVKHADATAIIGTNLQSPGCKLTLKYCKELNKPALLFPIPGIFDENLLNEYTLQLTNDIIERQITTLNVAGNRDKYGTLHYDFTFSLILKMLLLLEEQNLVVRK